MDGWVANNLLTIMAYQNTDLLDAVGGLGDQNATASSLAVMADVRRLTDWNEGASTAEMVSEEPCRQDRSVGTPQCRPGGHSPIKPHRPVRHARRVAQHTTSHARKRAPIWAGLGGGSMDGR